MDLVMMNRKRHHDLDFSNQGISVYDFKRDRVISKINFGHIVGQTSHTRASETLMVDASGIYHTFPPNQVAQTNLGMKVTPSVTNQITSAGMGGAVVGEVTNSGVGRLPTSWVFAEFDTLTVLEIGVEDGLPFIELRGIRSNVSGDAEYPSVLFGNSAAPANGQEWNSSVYVKKVAGEWNPTASNVILLVRQNSGGGNVFAPTADRTDDVVSRKRFKTSWTNTADDPMSINVWVNFAPGIDDGEDLNITLRIYTPQLEIGSYANDPVPTNEGVNGISHAITVFDDVNQFDLSVGAIYMEFDYLKQYEKEPHTNDYGHFFSIGDNINIIKIFSTPPSGGEFCQLLIKSGDTIIQPSLFSMPLGDYKIVAAWSLTDIKLFINGALVASAALAQPFTSTDFEKLYIGSDENGVRQSTTIYKSAVLFDQILSDAEYVELTS